MMGWPVQMVDRGGTGSYVQGRRGGVLTWEELSEVLLDVETQINRQPLNYAKDDVFIVPVD